MSDKNYQEIDYIETIGKLSEKVEDIAVNPILKPLLEYTHQSLELINDEKLERNYLDVDLKVLNEQLSDGDYDDSRIVKLYEQILRIYQRLIFNGVKHSRIADNTIGDLKKMVESYYITKVNHEQMVKLLQDRIKYLEDKNKELEIKLNSKEVKNEKITGAI